MLYPMSSSSSSPCFPVVTRATLRRWSAAAALVLAAVLTVAFALHFAFTATTATDPLPWVVYVLEALLLCALWSGVRLLHGWSDTAIAALVVASAFGLPLLWLVILISFGD